MLVAAAVLCISGCSAQDRKIDERKKGRVSSRCQFKDENAEKRSKQEGGDIIKTHRKWLSELTGQRIDFFKNMCTKQRSAARPLIDLTFAVR